jgi:hypothetical protein
MEEEKILSAINDLKKEIFTPYGYEIERLRLVTVELKEDKREIYNHINNYVPDINSFRRLWEKVEELEKKIKELENDKKTME